MYASDDPNDTLLTPNSFLQPGNQVPEEAPPGMLTPSMYRKSYEFLQHLVNLFWDVWTREYLPSLQTRGRWQSIVRDVRPNDLVLIVDLGLPRGYWRTGRVVETFPGRNNRVRAARIKTIGRKKIDFFGNLTAAAAGAPTYIIRPVSKLCLLRAAEDEPNLELPQVPEEFVEEGGDE
jgi:hypothetical protein